MPVVPNQNIICCRHCYCAFPATAGWYGMMLTHFGETKEDVVLTDPHLCIDCIRKVQEIAPEFYRWVQHNYGKAAKREAHAAQNRRLMQ